MKKKTWIAVISSCLVVAGAGAYCLIAACDASDDLSAANYEKLGEPDSSRELASTSPTMTIAQYEAMNACDKQELLWRNMKATEYKALPDFESFGAPQLWALSRQAIAMKGNRASDFAPKGWKKLLHAHGSIAKVKIVPKESGLTGIFQGADCALLRLSITFKPGLGRGVAPGLVLKVLRDKVPSANVSALVSLAGQEKDYNFFAHPLSNIVPIGDGIGQKIVHRIFAKVTSYPEELLTSDMAATDAHGARAATVVSPRQLFFVPNAALKPSSDEHDVRKDFAKIPAGTVLYRVMAVSDKRRDFDYANYGDADVEKFLGDSQHVADIVTTSEFVASAFGDDGIFFRHQLRK